MARVYLSIGANLGDPVAQLRQTVESLRLLGVVSGVSSFYRTKPWGGIVDQPDFINAVVALETSLPPHELLVQLKATESRLGRNETVRWGPRVIDIDILTYDDRVVDEPELAIPHPRMYERAFVLAPLAELDPTYKTALQSLPSHERASAIKL